MYHSKSKPVNLSGFTLIELMIVVAIIGLISSIAIPQYINYTSRTKASLTAAELAPYKVAIAICAQMTGALTICSPGNNGVPTLPSPATANAAGLSISSGIMTGTSAATTTSGTAFSFTLAPEMTAGQGTMPFKMTGSICNETRGLKTGSGGC